MALQAVAVKPCVIPSESMSPMLVVGQRLLVDRFSHHIGGDPKLGDPARPDHGRAVVTHWPVGRIGGT